MVKHLTTVGLVLALVLMATTAPAAILLQEDWEAGFNKAVWTSSTTRATGVVTIGVDGDWNHTAASTNSLNAQGVNLGQNTDMVTCVVNTVGEARVIVSMWYRPDQRDNMEWPDFMKVRISPDNATWTTVWELWNGHAEDGRFYPMYVVLPAWAINQATLYVQFQFCQNGNGEGYSMDDIVIGDGGIADPTIGNILWEVYNTDGGGGDLWELTDHWIYPNYPQVSTFLDLDGRTTTVETPTNWQHNYGQRLAAYLEPPTTGDYTFWCVSDDNSQLWLSTDTDPANAALVSWTAGWAGARNWASGNVQARSVSLVAGQQYFMEVLMREGGGGDNLAVGWQGPGITGDDERPIPLTHFGPALVSVQDVVRTMPATYARSTAFTVTLDLTPGATAGPLDLTEELDYPGVTLSNPIASAGSASVVANTVVWNIPDVGMAPATLTYDVTVGPPSCGVWIEPSGTWRGGLALGDVIGDSRIVQADDGWMSAPIPWVDATDVGAVDAAGHTEFFACGVYQMWGAGADVWGNHDEMQFIYTWVNSDFTIAAHVTGLLFVQDNTKMGLMVRDDVASGSAMISTEISERDDNGKGQGISIQARVATAGGTVRTVGPRVGNNGDAYLVLTRRMASPAPDIACYHDTLDPDDAGLKPTINNQNDPNAPTHILTSPTTVLLDGEVAVGMYVVGHNEPQLGIGQFDNVFITSSSSILDTLDAGDLTVTRDLPPTGYTAGGAALPVTLTMTPATVAGAQVVSTETLPAGMTPGNVVASSGAGVIKGNSIVWTLTSVASTQTLTYDATPTAGACNDQVFAGFYETGPVAFLGLPPTAGLPIGGDSKVAQLPGAGDIWQNALILWDGAGDIGAVGIAGSTDRFACDERYELVAEGADVWGTADEFQFIYFIVPGDFSVEATVSYPYTPPLPFPPANHWTKAGVMLRDNLSAGSPNMTMGIAWRDARNHFIPQWRDAQDGGTGNNESGPDALASGGRVNLSRVGTMVTAGYDNLAGNANTSNWQRDMPNISPTSYVGLWVVSHQDGAVSLGRFENVALTTTLDRTITLSAETCVRDLPTTAYDPSDAIPVTLTATPYSFTVGAPFACTETVPLALTIQNPVASAGSIITSGSEMFWTIPNMTQVETLTYEAVVPSSACGDTYQWSGVFSNGLDVWPVTGVDQAGAMADNGWANAPIQWYGSDDTGCAGFPGQTLYFTCDQSYQITGGGRDIWGRDDGCHYLWMQVEGDFAIAATVEWVSAPDGWSKAGIWARNSLDSGSENVGVMIRRDGLVNTQRRTAERDNTQGGAQSPVNAPPNRIYMTRAGTVFTLGYDDLATTDANPALQVWDTPEVQGVCLLGLGVTGHSAGAPGTALFTNVVTTGVTPAQISIGTVSRTFSDTSGVIDAYQWGTVGEPPADDNTFTVTITATAPGPNMASLTLVEYLPPGATVTNVTDAGGAVVPTVTADSIIWNTAAGWGPPGGQVSYDIIIPWDPNFPAHPYRGGYAEASNGQRVVTENVLFHQGKAMFQQGLHPDVNYKGTDDSFVIVYQTNNNIGVSEELEEGDWGGGTGDHKKVLIGMDVSAYPPTRVAGMSAAELRLYHSRYRRGNEGTDWFAADHQVAAARILRDWNEGCGSGADGNQALPGEVSWNDAMRAVDPWERAGVMGLTDVADASASTTIVANQFGWYSWDVLADAPDMINTPGANYGWKVSQDPNRDVDDNTNTYVQGPYDFHSSEYLGDATLRPMMVIWDGTPVPVEVSTFMLY